MSLCLFAVQRILHPENEQEPRIQPTQYILHTAVSAASSLAPYFGRESVKTESHFYINAQGVIEQYVDTERQADAQWEGNRHGVSVETWDGGAPEQNPWNPAQIDSLVRLGHWLRAEHGIPMHLCPGPQSPGVGYHRLFYEWNKSKHSCPGNLRVSQFHGEVLPRLAGGTPAPAPAPAPAHGPRTLKLTRPFMKGSDVAEVQRAVGSTADGVFGPNTKAAVVRFQRAHGLSADGIVGPKTWAAIRAPAPAPAPAPGPAPTPAPTPRPMIRLGSKGQAVKDLQWLLNVLAGQGLKVDGDFGPKTETAVKNWQRFFHLGVDGIVGPQTWRSLYEIKAQKGA